jgi:hypothetical protein
MSVYFSRELAREYQLNRQDAKDAKKEKRERE